MGHDAFFSYAHVDNMAHSDFIERFHEMLTQKITARLEMKFPRVNRNPDLFIDHEGLPANGPVNATLEMHVKQSEFLFIFVGLGYLNSDYCQSERTWFRQAFAENAETARERTFLIFLTAEALERVSAKDAPDDLRQMRNSIFWKDFSKPRSPDRPMDPMLTTRDNQLEDNPKFTEILDEIAVTYVDRYRKAVDQPRGDEACSELMSALRNVNRKDSKSLTVAVGAIAKNLEEFRNQVIGALKDNKTIAVDVIDYAALVDDKEKVAKRIGAANAFLQIFDDGPVRAQRDDPDGGHLEVQRAMLPAGKPALYWMPPEAQRSAQKEARQADAKVIGALAENARTGSAQDAAVELARLLTGPRDDVAATVLVECTPKDLEIVNTANSMVKRIWADVAKDMPIQFPLLAWDSLEDLGYLNSVHGIIVVDRSRQQRSLLDQYFKMQKQLDDRNVEISQRLFVLPPKETAGMFNWPFFVFRKAENQLQLLDEDRDRLKQFLVEVKNRAMRAGGAAL
jgi:hypothetical protein